MRWPVDVEHSHVRFLGNLVLNLWDCGGCVRAFKLFTCSTFHLCAKPDANEPPTTARTRSTRTTSRASATTSSGASSC